MANILTVTQYEAEQILKAQTTVATPASGYVAIYAKADGRMYGKDDAGTEFLLENSSNKATNFSTINDTLYPTVKAVDDRINLAVTGLLDYRGSYDASTNLFPATGGSGIAGAVLKGDFWIASVAGTLGGAAVTAGDLIIALVDTPAQVSSNWDTIDHDVSGGGGIPDGDYGDITVSGGGTIWTIDTTLYEEEVNATDVTLSDNQLRHRVIEIDASGGVVTVTLDDSLLQFGAIYTIKKMDPSANEVVITPSNSTIDQVGGFTLTAENQSITIFSSSASGNQRYILSEYNPNKVTRVVHGATASVARPIGAKYIEWVGSVEPTNAIDGDTWYQT